MKLIVVLWRTNRISRANTCDNTWVCAVVNPAFKYMRIANTQLVRGQRRNYPKLLVWNNNVWLPCSCDELAVLCVSVSLVVDLYQEWALATKTRGPRFDSWWDLAVYPLHLPYCVPYLVHLVIIFIKSHRKSTITNSISYRLSTVLYSNTVAGIFKFPNTWQGAMKWRHTNQCTIVLIFTVASTAYQRWGGQTQRVDCDHGQYCLDRAKSP